MRIETVAGDITRQRVDAIVNAANSSLLGGGGVDGAIHRRGGPAIMEECRRLGGCPTGDAKATTAGRIDARYVIHAVGPNRDRGQTDPALLASCFTRSLEVAAALPARSVAFPAVSAGAFGWPLEEVAEVAVRAVREFASAAEASDAEGGGAVELLRFVLFGEPALAAFERAVRSASG